MATFTATDSAVVIDRDVVFFPWKLTPGEFQPDDTREFWMKELRNYRELNGGYGPQGIRIGTRSHHVPITGDVIVVGHGFTCPAIAKEKDKALPADKLADRLVAAGVAENYAGKIIMWTCFSGAAKGIAESLVTELRIRKRMTVSVWGCRHATARIRDGKFYCFPQTTPEDYSSEVVGLATSAHVVAYGAV